MKIFGIVTAVLAFIICAVAGAALLRETGFNFSKQNVLVTALGLYFIGKGVYVGAHLFLEAQKATKQA